MDRISIYSMLGNCYRVWFQSKLLDSVLSILIFCLGDASSNAVIAVIDALDELLSNHAENQDIRKLLLSNRGGFSSPILGVRLNAQDTIVNYLARAAIGYNLTLRNAMTSLTGDIGTKLLSQIFVSWSDDWFNKVNFNDPTAGSFFLCIC